MECNLAEAHTHTTARVPARLLELSFYSACNNFPDLDYEANVAPLEQLSRSSRMMRVGCYPRKVYFSLGLTFNNGLKGAQTFTRSSLEIRRARAGFPADFHVPVFLFPRPRRTRLMLEVPFVPLDYEEVLYLLQLALEKRRIERLDMDGLALYMAVRSQDVIHLSVHARHPTAFAVTCGCCSPLQYGTFSPCQVGQDLKRLARVFEERFGQLVSEGEEIYRLLQVVE